MKIFRDQGHLKGEITAMHRLAQVDQAFCPIQNFQKNGKFRTISFVRKILALFFFVSSLSNCCFSLCTEWNRSPMPLDFKLKGLLAVFVSLDFFHNTYWLETRWTRKQGSSSMYQYVLESQLRIGTSWKFRQVLYINHQQVSGWWFHIFFICFHPYLGKWSNLTHIFQMGWNNQQV